MFTPSQIKTTIHPNTFTAQDAGIYSNAELNHFWNRIFFPNILILHFSYAVKLLVILSFHLTLLIMMQIHLMIIHDYYNTLPIGFYDKLINATPLFTPTWFSDAFITLFGYPCYS